MIKYAIMGLTALILASCGSQPPTNFYTLSAVDTGTPIATSVKPVTVGQIDLPASLDRNQLVRRISDQQIVVLSFDRWAAPLEDNISRALTVDLEKLLPAQALIRSDGTPFDTSVGVIDLYVDRFDADYAGHVTFDVAWSITSGNPQKTQLRHTEHITGDAGNGSPAAMVQAMSQAVGDLAVKIATQLTTH